MSAKRCEQLKSQLPEKSPSTKEYESMLKLIIGMASAQYNFVSDKKSPAVGQISDDLNEVGIQLHQDTIRKFLKLWSRILTY